MKRATPQYRQCHYGFSNFNPRPREEGDSNKSIKYFIAKNFNPRPREEGDDVGKTVSDSKHTISIHALVKRATQSALDGGLCLWISIHALVKRATRHSIEGFHFGLYFNPRPREEGDTPYDTGLNIPP